jgi:hypothetical protein
MTDEMGSKHRRNEWWLQSFDQKVWREQITLELGTEWMIIDLRGTHTVDQCGLELFGSEQGTEVDSYWHGHEPSGLIKDEAFHE